MKKLLIVTVVVLGAITYFTNPNLVKTTLAQTQSYNQATVSWQTQPDAKCYRIYYKETGASSWQFSVHCKNLPASSYMYTIGYLKPHTSYTYMVVAVNNVDKHETSLGTKQMVTTAMAQ